MLTRVAAADSGAETPDADKHLQQVTVEAHGVSNMDAASAGDVDQARIATEPTLRPAAVLENVPGLIVTQHSGEGKANQYFLRAFNLDHGTDLALEVDDMPVNMPSHAHGQGYADLNFLIPELLTDLHYKKGPYYADEGDFATAGAVRLALAHAAPDSISLGYGQDGYRRALVLTSTPLGEGTLLAAGEAYRNNGPFEYPDDYQRLNGLLRYFGGSADDYFTLTAMAYSGRWNATDQIPQRALSEGLLGRFGSLNPSDGGESTRTSLSFLRLLRTNSGEVAISAYVIDYGLDLFSTFTYYLQDPTYGDQMLQHDDRVVYGFKASRSWFGNLAGASMSNVIGVQGRLDDIRDVGVFPTYQRLALGTTQNAGVVESGAAVYAENTVQWTPWLRTVLGARLDRFDYNVTDKMLSPTGACSDPLGCDTGKQHAALFSPKLGVVLGPWNNTTVFVNLGDGYHSNDARGVTRSGTNPEAQPVTPLTRATGAEVGLATAPLPRWNTRLDVFLLKLKSELVFDGDAGVTSPSGATTRTGIEWANTWRINQWLATDWNAAVTRARFDQTAGPDDLGCALAAPSHPCGQPIAIYGRYIPNSPTNVIDAGVSAGRDIGWYATLRARHFGESPLVEDNSARSPAYTTLDAQIGFHSGHHWQAALDVFNLGNAGWNDIEYYYVSRLRTEAVPQADYVAHPGVPRTLRAHVQYQF